jgi:hypothetical protein
LNPLLKRLERIGIIFQGEARKARKHHVKDGDYKEFPYYLKKSLDSLRIMIKEIAETRINEKWYIFEIFSKSNYLESMRTEFGRGNVDETIQDQLLESYDVPFPEIMEIIRPTKKYAMMAPVPEAEPIRYWYECRWRSFW